MYPFSLCYSFYRWIHISLPARSEPTAWGESKIKKRCHQSDNNKSEYIVSFTFWLNSPMMRRLSLYITQFHYKTSSNTSMHTTNHVFLCGENPMLMWRRWTTRKFLIGPGWETSSDVLWEIVPGWKTSSEVLWETTEGRLRRKHGW